MVVEQTLAIIKPDSVEKGIIGEITNRIDEASLKITGIKMLHLDKALAEGFYAVHKDKPFFESLVKFMTSGPVVVQVLEGTDAVKKYRDVMGATDPSKAAEGTIRKLFAENIERNSVHGSDSQENAALEISLNFKPDEIVG